MSGGFTDYSNCVQTGERNVCPAASLYNFNNNWMILTASISCPLDAASPSEFRQASQEGRCICTVTIADYDRETQAVTSDAEELSCDCFICPESQAAWGVAYTCTDPVFSQCYTFDCFGTCNGDLYFFDDPTESPTANMTAGTASPLDDLNSTDSTEAPNNVFNFTESPVLVPSNSTEEPYVERRGGEDGQVDEFSHCFQTGGKNVCPFSTLLGYMDDSFLLTSYVTCPLDAFTESDFRQASQNGRCTCTTSLAEYDTTAQEAVPAYEDLSCDCFVCPESVSNPWGVAFSCSDPILGVCYSFDCSGTCHSHETAIPDDTNSMTPSKTPTETPSNSPSAKPTTTTTETPSTPPSVRVTPLPTNSSTESTSDPTVSPTTATSAGASSPFCVGRSRSMFLVVVLLTTLSQTLC